MRPIGSAKTAIARLRAGVGEHSVLVKNSGAVAAGTVITAALGFVYWWIAARAFPPEAVGRASALLSLIGLVGVFAESGLGTLLTGEIITRRGRERGLIAAAAIVAVSVSVAAGGVLALVRLLSPEVALRMGPGGSSDLWLIAGCGLTGLGLVIDQAFVGMLRGGIRMLRQFLFSAGKLALLAIAAGWSGNETVLLATWVSGQMISLIPVGFLARCGGSSLIERPDFSLMRALSGRLVGHYMLDLAIQAPILSLPLLVTVLLSPAFNAAFSAIWMVMSVAFVVPAASAAVLFPAVKAEPHRYRDRMLLSLAASLAFAVAFGLFVFFFSTQILRLFNPVYVEIAGPSLRFLGFGLIGAVAKFHACAAARLSNRMRPAAVWFGVGALLELACGSLGCKAAGLEGLALGWTGALAVEALAMLLLVTRPRAARPGSWGIAAKPVVEN